MPPPPYEARPYACFQGISYQDAMKLVDGSQPQYLFPQYSGKGPSLVSISLSFQL